MALVAVITGASSGIGRATALLFAEKGYHLSLSGRNEEALNEVQKECVGKGVAAENIVLTLGDISDKTIAKSLIDRTLEKFGKIDSLVNAAGIIVNGTVADTPLQEYDHQMNINVRSIVQLTQMAIPHLIKAKGSVVNVSSVTGTNAFPGVTYYCMSKAAIDQFTKCLALELASTGVRVNAVNPGVIITQVHKRGGMNDEAYAAFLEKCKTTHALGRAGEAREVAQGIYYLASDMSSFTTGHLLAIDGGRGIMTPR
ncbi:hypothetical protein QR680_007552 [Steinernema hermaphroditum]|uniref:Uncharacterized protein n=1 Tax=Steinernema hermaphroditum TaxID=289476 RepID=A0AA39M6K9_9BILA|nr:hypothetical protein QR680_007552 [Steinernema hermaphroditum]